HDRQREEEKEERERRERENEKKREESDKRRSAREKKMKERFKSVVDNAFHVKQKKEQVDEEQKQRQLERITEKLQQAESRKKTQQQNKIRFASLEIKKVELISSPKRQQEYRKKSSRIRPPPPSKSRSHYDNSSSSLPSHSHGHSTHKSYPQYTKTLVTSFQYASALSYSMVMSYFTTVFANQDLMQSQGGSIPLISKESTLDPLFNSITAIPSFLSSRSLTLLRIHSYLLSNHPDLFLSDKESGSQKVSSDDILQAVGSMSMNERERVWRCVCGRTNESSGGESGLACSSNPEKYQRPVTSVSRCRSSKTPIMSAVCESALNGNMKTDDCSVENGSSKQAPDRPSTASYIPRVNKHILTRSLTSLYSPSLVHETCLSVWRCLKQSSLNKGGKKDSKSKSGKKRKKGMVSSSSPTTKGSSSDTTYVSGFASPCSDFASSLSLDPRATESTPLVDSTATFPVDQLDGFISSLILPMSYITSCLSLASLSFAPSHCLQLICDSLMPIVTSPILLPLFTLSGGISVLCRCVCECVCEDEAWVWLSGVCACATALWGNVQSGIAENIRTYRQSKSKNRDIEKKDDKKKDDEKEEGSINCDSLERGFYNSKDTLMCVLTISSLLFSPIVSCSLLSGCSFILSSSFLFLSSSSLSPSSLLSVFWSVSLCRGLTACISGVAECVRVSDRVVFTQSEDECPLSPLSNSKHSSSRIKEGHRLKCKKKLVFTSSDDSDSSSDPGGSDIHPKPSADSLTKVITTSDRGSKEIQPSAFSGVICEESKTLFPPTSECSQSITPVVCSGISVQAPTASNNPSDDCSTYCDAIPPHLLNNLLSSLPPLVSTLSHILLSFSFPDVRRSFTGL
ncbi:hypothetical protein ADUPG1_011229, partial [Aduncisulcus paluster]